MVGGPEWVWGGSSWSGGWWWHFWTEWERGREASGWDEGERGEEERLLEVEWWDVGRTKMGLERGWPAVYVTCWDGVFCYGLDGGIETRVWWVLRFESMIGQDRTGLYITRHGPIYVQLDSGSY